MTKAAKKAPAKKTPAKKASSKATAALLPPWNSGLPPRRGAYKVRCDGPNPNLGYRYCDGKQWGSLMRTAKDARAVKTGGRLRTTVHPILWRE